MDDIFAANHAHLDVHEGGIDDFLEELVQGVYVHDHVGVGGYCEQRVAVDFRQHHALHNIHLPFLYFIILNF